ncbi:DDE-type integrase/transposase/recombinase [Streptomyces sp. NPDC056149]|uniref:DDE-type integrase/transposase/recombinase n=1 Tax=unclassified Streptomyces TaxID=2593676 RepID=UPI002380F9BD|nr:DDE-type integrase/transposase/recombinase [Streptomyces sp. WZ-12]
MNTVAKLMAELDLAGRMVRRRRGLTRPGKRAAAPDFVRRSFTADAPDHIFAGDVTEIVTDEGKPYLATVIDPFPRRLLGYARGAHHDAELVVAALNMARATRGGGVRGMTFPSDRGGAYALAASVGPAAAWRDPCTFTTRIEARLKISTVRGDWHRRS